MKHIKSIKCLCLIFFLVCFIILSAPMKVFAVQHEGNTVVMARIEASSDEASQPDTEPDENSEKPEKKINSESPKTGSDSNLDFEIVILLISVSAFTITMCSKRKKTR